MLGSHVARSRAERKFLVKASWPSVAAVSGAERNILLGEVDTGIVPWVAVSAVAGFHGNERRLGCVAGGVFEERSRGSRLVLTSDEGREGRHATWLAEAFED